MAQQVLVAVSDLLLDEANARIGQETASQQQAAFALAQSQGRRLVRLARSITEDGLDPAQLLSVVATGDRRRKYIVLEGNRRLLAIKALETPTIIQGALGAAEFKQLQTLSNRYHSQPIESLSCILYEQDEIAVFGRVLRRHAGSQDGAGLVEWGSDEKDRFAARHGSQTRRSLGGQALDFIAAVEGKPVSQARIATNLTRMLGSPEIRAKLGLERVQGELRATYSRDQVARALKHVIDGLVDESVNVKDIYTADDRKTFAARLPADVLPDPTRRLPSSVGLPDLAAGSGDTDPSPSPPPPTPRRRKQKIKAPRTSVASPESGLNPSAPRANAIFNEIVQLSADQFPNAASVLLRVFLELSVDEYGKRESVLSDKDRKDWVLAKRMKTVAEHLESTSKIDNQLKKAITKIADSQQTLAASVTAFHQYVHNPYVFPKASELRTAWDELQPFLEVLWE